MLKIYALNPFSEFKVLENQDKTTVSEKFKSLSKLDKTIIVIATAVITLLTLTFFSSNYFSSIVHRFKKNSDEDLMKIEVKLNPNILDQPDSGLNNVEPTTAIPDVIKVEDIKKKVSLDQVDKPAASTEPTKNGEEQAVLSKNLELNFWNKLTEDKKFYNYFQMILLNGQPPKKQAERLVEMYLKTLEESPDSKEKSLLVVGVSEQISLNRNCFNLGKPNHAVNLTETAHLNIFSTRGDGSCGFHAILGECQNQAYQCKNIKKLREDFCDALIEQYNRKELAPEIYTILSNYALDFSVAPFNFQKSAADKYGIMKEGYEELSLKDQQVRLDGFIYDPVVIKAYTDHMKEVSTLLLQDELIVIGKHYGKRVLIFQNGWYNRSHEVNCNFPEALEPGFEPLKDDVCVWFSGFHYERALIDTIGSKPRKSILAHMQKLVSWT